jgi:hypothetical protein
MPCDVALGYYSLKINKLWRSRLSIYEHSPEVTIHFAGTLNRDDLRTFSREGWRQAMPLCCFQGGAFRQVTRLERVRGNACTCS